MRTLLVVVVLVLASTAVSAPLADPFIQVAAGDPTCAVRASGTVACFTGDDPVFRTVAGVSRATQVAVHFADVACVVLRDGKVQCFDLLPSRNEKIVSPSITASVPLPISR